MKYFLIIISLLFYINAFCQNPCPGTETVEYQGRIYHTVLINNQCWLKENINIGMKKNNRIGMNLVNQFDNNIIEKYCYDDLESNCDEYGGLYQWAEAVQYKNGASNNTTPSFTGFVQGICPEGWHIPQYSEIKKLATYIDNDGRKINKLGTNTTGFSGLLSGYSYASSLIYLNMGYETFFWTTKTLENIHASTMWLSTETAFSIILAEPKINGNCVRCIKDITTPVTDEVQNVNKFSLDQNFPNPFNPSTTIKYSIPVSNIVSLKVYNILGKEVADLVNEYKNSGTYEVEFNAANLSSGTYFYKIKSGNYMETKKLLLLK